MLLRISLWAMLLGSVIMGFFGWQTGSATTTVVGIIAFLIAGFILFFLAKLMVHIGAAIIKFIVIGALLLMLGFGLYRGGMFLLNAGKEAVESGSQKITSWETAAESASFSERLRRFFIDDDYHHSDKGKKPLKPVSQQVQPSQTPFRQGSISGIVSRVRTGYLFELNGHFIKLFGMDAPDLAQTCLDKRQQKYDCGHQAKERLERLILGKNVTCQILMTTPKSDYVAVCTLGEYDIGATMISVGWAVANRALTDVYVPYEDMAHQKHLGLWEGQFVAPWTFRKQTATGTKTPPKQTAGWKDWF